MGATTGHRLRSEGVEVTLTPEGLERMRVELEHRNLERFGEGAARARASLDSGWLGILQRFAGEAAKGWASWRPTG
jgi:hypothetical protein